MTGGTDWSLAFPLLAAEAARAVEAVVRSWTVLAATHTVGFNPTRKEPDLTRVLHHHVDTVSAQDLGLFGMWVTEPVVNAVDPTTRQIREERRLDIVYGWNDDGRKLNIRMVFEFKKVSNYKRSRMSYLDHNGLTRFVNGLYSKNQPIAAMAAILMASEREVVDPIRNEMNSAGAASRYSLVPDSSGLGAREPSPLFPAFAKFDTHHTRPAGLAHPHGPIQVGHLFLAFGYALPAPTKRPTSRKSRKKAKPASS